MSELIDRIFDVEKISGEVAAILTQLGKATEGLNGYKDAVTALISETRKAKGNDDLINNSKLLNDTVVKGGVEMKRYEAEVEKLRQKTEQLTTSEKAASIEIAKARLELAAATKATKDAAIEQIVLGAKTNGLAKNYYDLKEELKLAEKQFKSLSVEEQKGAQGKDLMKKYNELNATINKTDESFGHFQNRVGQYENASKSLKAELKEIVQQLAQMSLNGEINSEAYKKLAERGGELKETISDVQMELKNTGSDTKGIDQIVGTFQAVGAAAQVAQGTAALFGAESEDVTKSIQQLVAVQSVMNGVQEIWNAIQKESTFMMALQAAKAKILAGWKITLTTLERIFGITAAESMALASAGITILISGIILLIANFDAVINSLKSFFGITNKFEATENQIKNINKALENFKDLTNLISERLKSEGKTDKEVLDFKKRRFEEELKMNRDRYTKLKSLTRDLTDDEKKNLEESAAFIRESAKVKYAIDTEYINLKKTNGEKATEDGNKQDKKIIKAQRQLTDSQFALMKDGKDKQLKVSQETYNREIEDLRKNGELTKTLKSNLEKAQKAEVTKITNEWKIKTLNELIKFDEIEISHMEKTGQDTLKAKKDLLQKQMDAEILAGGDLVNIHLKYQYLSTDLETENNDKKIENFKKLIAEKADALSAGYQKEEIELKKQYSKGLMSEKDFNQAMTDLKLKSLLETNQSTIDALKIELKNFKGSDDKKKELSKQLRDLEIANENAVVDATIKANDDKVKSDKDATAKRMEIAKALMSAANEIFGAIADYEIKQSEQKVAGYEKELEASWKKFDGEQANLDNAIMSDESRAEKQNEINTKKAAAEKVIQDKIQAEKIKQAKWERDKNIANAIITAGLAILTGLNNVFPLNLIAVALATTLGAIQVTSIMSTPLPAYEKGGTTGAGLALWGEVRPEVAVLPSGQTFIADKPTISNFDAGTKIYKSVSDYENFMSKQSVNQMVFDYDKFGEKMPQNNIILDSSGLWSIVNKQNSRRTLINRRYSNR